MQPASSQSQTPASPSGPRTAVPAKVTWKESANPTAAVAAGFCALLVCFLLISHLQSVRHDPLTSKALANLKGELVKNPTNDALKKEIRALDLQLRKVHDRHLVMIRRGSYLLAGGMMVFVVALQYAMWRRKLPCPLRQPKPPGTDERKTLTASVAVGCIGGLWALAALWLGHSSDTDLSASLLAKTPPPDGTNTPAAAAGVSAVAATAAAQSPFPTLDEVRKNWPQFRGPEGTGVAVFTNAPTSWNVAVGEGVIWKTDLPGADVNSPVVWDNFVFLSTGTAQKKEVLCHDLATGKLLWQKAVQPTAGITPPALTLPDSSSGYAACTLATDGRRVYAIFANADVVAFDYQGNQVWYRNFGKLDNSYGHANSLALYQDKLFLQIDQADPKDGNSKVFALETSTGKTAWETQKREVAHSWSTPLVLRSGDKAQLITASNPWVISYDAATGTELWKAKVLGGEVTPSPTAGAGLAFVVNEGTQLSALKTDGTGDVTKTHVAWSADEGLPDIVSPLCDGERVYLTQTYGLLTCFEARTGKKLWENDFSVEFKGSPTLVGDKIYLFTEKGTGILMAAGATFKELGRAEVGDDMLASPAFLDGRMVLRTRKWLVCLGKK